MSVQTHTTKETKKRRNVAICNKLIMMMMMNRAFHKCDKYREVIGQIKRNSARTVSSTEVALNVLSTGNIPITLTPRVVDQFFMNLKSVTPHTRINNIL